MNFQYWFNEFENFAFLVTFAAVFFGQRKLKLHRVPDRIAVIQKSKHSSKLNAIGIGMELV